MILGRPNGQSLFETVVAVGIISLILVAVVSLATSSVRDSSFARNDALATKYAQEGVEWLREQRDASWSTFVANTANTCLGTLVWGAGCTITGTIFQRSISFNCLEYDSGPPPTTMGLSCSDPQVNMVDTIVEVGWTDSQGTHNVRSVSTLTKWR